MFQEESLPRLAFLLILSLASVKSALSPQVDVDLVFEGFEVIFNMLIPAVVESIKFDGAFHEMKYWSCFYLSSSYAVVKSL